MIKNIFNIEHDFDNHDNWLHNLLFISNYTDKINNVKVNHYSNDKNKKCRRKMKKNNK